METMSLKLEKSLAKNIEKTMKENDYTTKTEFVREAIREKISKLEMKKIFKVIEELRRKNPRRTTDADLRRARERVSKQLEEEFKEVPQEPLEL
ncbi:MAG: ribbon-helix-helix domain-containing protein [Candidatus Woesearchaeota archaeon]|nr:ribbon-helix-helix domain-containing protein [Candidatus Woesearchaeota archaeon]